MTYGHFPTGWAHAMSTPFPYFKRVASHLGATRNAMVLSWPRRAPDVRGEVRSQYHYLTDIVPTILDAAGIEPPQAVDGIAPMRSEERRVGKEGVSTCEVGWGRCHLKKNK